MITFIESGNRIATENFATGGIYTITFTNGNYRTMCCIGIGSDFVMFQGTMPNTLFCLTMGTSETVVSIDLGGGGGGSMNYNELENKPQINGITLIGNKTGSELGLVSQIDLDNYVTDTELTTELADYATNASVVSALASKQDQLTTTQLNAVNSGITSSLVTQIGINTTAIAGKQNQLTTTQLNAVNSGITSVDVTQITTNKNNILTLESKNGRKNYLNYDKTILQSLNTGGSWTDNVWTIGNGVTLTVNADNSITLNGTSTAGKTIYLARNLNLPSDTYILSMTTALITKLWAGMSAVGGGEYNFTSPNSYNSQRCQPNNIIIYIDSGCVLNNLTIYPMLCNNESWLISHTYQPYTMSNVEITAWIKAHS